MWDFLEKANSCGRDFRSKLNKEEGFSVTKWFGSISGPAKGACLLLALSGGLTGCNTVQFAGSYTDLQKEAKMINSMAIEEMAEFAKDRGVENLEAKGGLVSFDDLANDLVENDGTYPYEDPVLISNPFVEGQKFKVMNGGSISHQFDLMMDQGIRPANWVASLSGLTFVVNPDHPNPSTKLGMNSFHEPDRSLSIVLGENASRYDWLPDQSNLENASFVLFHEMAHGHLVEELVMYDDHNSDSFSDFADFHKHAFNEVHANVTASIMNYQKFELSPQEFQERLSNLKAYADHDMLAEANGDGTSSYYYRTQKSIEVLGKIVEQDKDFLKDIPADQVPVLSYELVKNAGFYHNMSELLIEKYSDLRDQNPSLNMDKQFLNDVAESYDDQQLESKSLELLSLWGKAEASQFAKNYKDGISKVANSPSPNISTDSLRGFVDKSELSGKAHDTFIGMINNHIEIIQSKGESENFGVVLERMSKDASDMYQKLPSREELRIERSRIIDDIEERITHLGKMQLNDDHQSHLATGQSPESTPLQIGSSLMENYKERSPEKKALANKAFAEKIKEKTKLKKNERDFGI